MRCEDKKRFKSEAAARESRRHCAGDRLRPYLCLVYAGWHLTHEKDLSRDARLARKKPA